MIKPNENVIKAILNLENNLFWKEILSWVKESLITQSVQNNNNTGEVTIKMQGRNYELAEFLKEVGKVHDYEKNAKEAKIREVK
jgi:hypothetical protein